MDAAEMKRLLGRTASIEEKVDGANLGLSLILFGEWCYAEHSVAYDALPDWFLVFDVYDRQEARFWSRTRRDALAGRVDLSVVPLLDEGVFSMASLSKQLGRSRVGNV